MSEKNVQPDWSGKEGASSPWCAEKCGGFYVRNDLTRCKVTGRGTTARDDMCPPAVEIMATELARLQAIVDKMVATWEQYELSGSRMDLHYSMERIARDEAEKRRNQQ